MEEIVQWVEEFRQATLDKDEVLAFDVLGGDFNLDNKSPGQLAHPHFSLKYITELLQFVYSNLYSTFIGIYMCLYLVSYMRVCVYVQWTSAATVTPYSPRTQMWPESDLDSTTPGPEVLMKLSTTTCISFIIFHFILQLPFSNVCESESQKFLETKKI